VVPWAIWCNTAVFDEAFSALDAFGYVNADFLPYFSPDPPATTSMPDVYASAYRLSNKALVVVANLSREDRTGTLRLNPKALRVSTEKTLSWPDKTPVPCDKGRVTLTVPHLGYRMLLVGSE